MLYHELIRPERQCGFHIQFAETTERGYWLRPPPVILFRLTPRSFFNDVSAEHTHSVAQP